jgi:hypothetical protein
VRHVRSVPRAKSFHARSKAFGSAITAGSGAGSSEPICVAAIHGRTTQATTARGSLRSTKNAASISSVAERGRSS